VQISSAIPLSFSVYAWNLPVSDFVFVEVTENMYLELEAFELNL